MKIFIFWFLIFSFSCSFSRISEKPKENKYIQNHSFELYDSNNDGQIDEKEFSEIGVKNNEQAQPITAMLLIIGSVAFMVMAPKIFSLIKNGVFNKD